VVRLAKHRIFDDFGNQECHCNRYILGRAWGIKFKIDAHFARLDRGAGPEVCRQFGKQRPDRDPAVFL
jgi:hypothetical protein